MKCPSCGKEQPFDVKCVQCDTDIAASLTSQKMVLNLYRGATIALFVLSLWLATYSRPSSRNPSPPFREAAQVDETKLSSESLDIRTNPQNPPPVEAAPATSVTIFLYKSIFQHYKILEGFRDYYPGKVQSVGLEQERDVRSALMNNQDSESRSLTVAIGEGAIQGLADLKADTRSILVSLEGEIPTSLAQRKNTFSFGPHFPVNAEFQLVHALFPERREMILVSKEPSKRPSDRLLRESNTRLKSVLPEATAVDLELNAFLNAKENEGPVVWFHEISVSDLQSILSLPSLEKVPTIASFFLEESDSDADDEPIENSASGTFLPLVEVRFSPYELGRQGAMVAMRMEHPEEKLDMTPYLKASLALDLHVTKALDMEREDLLAQLKTRGQREGLQVNLVP